MTRRLADVTASDLREYVRVAAERRGNRLTPSEVGAVAFGMMIPNAALRGRRMVDVVAWDEQSLDFAYIQEP